MLCACRTTTNASSAPGNFNFSNNTTANPNDLSNTRNSFASYLLGIVDSGNRTGSQEERLRNFDVSSYIQDDIKWNPKLTFNVGLRWDVMVPFSAVNNIIVYFDSTIPNPAAGGLLGAATKFGDCTGCAGVTRASIKWDHISPRGGFSYKLNDKTVLQGGTSVNFLNGGAYEYGISKVAVNYGNLLVGSYTRNSTGSTVPAVADVEIERLKVVEVSLVGLVESSGVVLEKMGRRSRRPAVRSMTTRRPRW